MLITMMMIRRMATRRARLYIFDQRDNNYITTGNDNDRGRMAI